MTEWEASGGVKIELAKQEVAALSTEIEAFEKAHPSTVVQEVDAVSGDTIVRAKIDPEPLPPLWTPRAASIIGCLGGSLDILWRNVMYPGGGGRSNRKSQFPIYDSAKKYELDRSRPIGGTKQVALNIVRDLKPYPDENGNILLWALRQADIDQKHIGLMRTAFAASARPMIPVWGVPGLISIAVEGPPMWKTVHHGAILDRWKSGPSAHVPPTYSLSVAFTTPKVIGGESVIELLRRFSDLVEGIAQTFIAAKLVH